MKNEQHERDRRGSRGGSQVTGLDPFGGNATGTGEDRRGEYAADETDVEYSFAGGGIARGGHSTARGTGGTGIAGTAGGKSEHPLDGGGSFPEQRHA